MNIPDTSLEEEITFNTKGSSIDDAFGDDFEIEDDCDDMEEDNYDDDIDDI